jgi:hypothetical protein
MTTALSASPCALMTTWGERKKKKGEITGMNENKTEKKKREGNRT